MPCIIIIGAGAAGLTCASELSKELNNCKIILIEQFSKSGRKILASGNGRCNISNKDMKIEYYNTNDPKIKNIIDNFNPVEYFGELGMLTKYTGNLLYPLSNQSLTVKNTLLNSLNNIEIIEDCKVSKITKDKKYNLTTNKGEFTCDYLVCAIGSKASKLSGEDNELLLKQMNLDITPIKPSLVQLKTKQVYRSLKGVRVKTKVSLLVDDKIIKTLDGEVLFTDNGLSGICIMQLSRYYYKYHNHKISVSLDLLSDYSVDEVNQLIRNRIDKYGNPYLSGIFTDKLAEVLQSIKNVDLKDFRFDIIGTNDYTKAQVMSGGVSLTQIDGNLECIKYKNMFVIGEALDVDGDCGGYNLHFAFGSGRHVGKIISDRVKENA